MCFWLSVVAVAKWCCLVLPGAAWCCGLLLRGVVEYFRRIMYVVAMSEVGVV